MKPSGDGFYRMVGRAAGAGWRGTHPPPGWLLGASLGPSGVASRQNRDLLPSRPKAVNRLRRPGCTEPPLALQPATGAPRLDQAGERPILVQSAIRCKINVFGRFFRCANRKLGS